MKNFLTIAVLLCCFPSFAQYTAVEIKKWKIGKITKLSATNGQEAIQKNETWYDSQGNDTAEYNGGELYRRTVYEHDLTGQVLTRSRYKADGKEIETAAYQYKPDGSYSISNTDRDFGMTDLTYYDKSGKLTKTVSPDRSERIYTYDSRGRLLKIKSKAGDAAGVMTDIQYAYNTKGQLIKEVSKGDYKWTSNYTYDAKGLIKKIKRNSVTDGVADPEVNFTYEYEFRK